MQASPSPAVELLPLPVSTFAYRSVLSRTATSASSLYRLQRVMRLVNRLGTEGLRLRFMAGNGKRMSGKEGQPVLIRWHLHYRL